MNVTPTTDSAQSIVSEIKDSIQKPNINRAFKTVLWLALLNCEFSNAKTVLDDSAYQLNATYTGDAFYSFDGGIKTGSTYLDDLNLTVEIDAEKAWGTQGLTMLASVIYNNGAALSSEFTGDDQGISSLETVNAIRLLELWAQWQLENDHSILFGLYDINSEFDVIPSAGLFVGSSHGIGRDFSQTGQNGPSTFPVTGLALRYQWPINSQWQWQSAVLDGVPGDPDTPRRTPIKISKNEGALLAMELARESSQLRKFAVGLWQYTALFEQFPTQHTALRESRSRNNRGAYVFADIALLQSSQQLSEPLPAKLSAFFRYGAANNTINRVAHYAGAGLVLRDVLPVQTESELGFAVSHARNGQPWRKLQRQFAQATESHETIVELTLKAVVNQWLSVQPTLQYVINPNSDPQLDNALALGLRFEIAFE